MKLKIIFPTKKELEKATKYSIKKYRAVLHNLAKR
jgi:hypothetical protein